MTKKLIIFNGPTASGKTLATVHAHGFLKNQTKLRTQKLAMSDAIKEGVHRTFGLKYGPGYYDSPETRAEKDQVHPKLMGRTLRQGYIDFSDALKAEFGDDVFGVIYANTVHNTNLVDVFLADGGIAHEWWPVINNMGASNVMVIELHGTINFALNDYRQFIGNALKQDYPDLTVRRINATPSGDPDDRMLFKLLIEGALTKFLEIEL